MGKEESLARMSRFPSLLRLAFFFLLCGVGLFSSCARAKFIPGGATVQTGIASWYGPDFHGKLTSNREIYNMYDLTAAHRFLPFGTQLIVTNLTNGRWIIVRINDRGPFVGDRIIDLSYAAASLIGMVGPGTVPVRLEILADQRASLSAPRYSLQIGAFVNENNAVELMSRLRGRYEGVYLSRFKTGHQTYFRVRVRAGSRQASEEIARRLCEDGYKVLILEEE